MYANRLVDMQSEASQSEARGLVFFLNLVAECPLQCDSTGSRRRRQAHAWAELEALAAVEILVITCSALADIQDNGINLWQEA